VSSPAAFDHNAVVFMSDTVALGSDAEISVSRSADSP
jgi:hypothetical protein